jgi:hypothetical protein
MDHSRHYNREDMRTEDRQEILDAVDAINETLTEQLFTEPYGMYLWIWVEAQMSNVGTVVMFLGECMYNSENDEREYIEDDNSGPDQYTVPGHYEDMEPYLRKQMRALLEKLGRIQL